MPNDITVTKNTTSGSERWDIQYTADQAGTIDKTLLTAGKLMDRNEKVSITIPSGTAGTPTATKGTVSSNSVSVTPSVTNVTGFITGGTKTGTAVTVSASELVSGTKNITASGTTDVTNYANASVSAMTLPTSTSTTSSGTNKATIGRSTSTRYINIPTGYNDSAAYYTISAVADGSATVSATITDIEPSMVINESTGIVTANIVPTSYPVTPTVTAGYISSGTQGTVRVSGSNTYQVPLQTLPTAASSTSSGTLKATISRSTAAQYINIPTGYNTTAVHYKVNAVANGSATTPATTITPNAITISVDSDGLITASNTQKTQNVTPTVSAGYVSTGTAGTITVSAASKTSQLSTIGATTYTPTTTDQTIASGKYLTGTQTISGDANLVQGNIKQGVTIFGVEGTYSGQGITLQSKTVSPTTSQQTVTADAGYDALSQVTVNAMPTMTLPTAASATHTGTSKATVNRSTSTQYINIPTGYNSAAAYYTISATPNGSAILPDDFVETGVGVTISNGTVTLDTVVEGALPVVTPGYISSGTPQDVYLELSGSIQMMTLPTSTSSTPSGTVKANVTPGTAAQYINIPTGYNTTAAHYAIKGDANLIPANIADGVTIFGVTGTHTGGGAIISTTQDSHGGDIITITTTESPIPSATGVDF